MNVNHAIESFSRYSSQEKPDFLLQLVHALTILARDTYEVGEDGLTNPSRMRRINEVQHRVANFLIALRKDDINRYPDDILVRLILEHPEDLDLQRQVQEVLGQLLAQRYTTT